MILQVGVKALLKNQEGDYLLIRRKEAFSDGTTWDIPGGRIDSDEELDEALEREITEEIGVRLTGKRTLVAAQDILVPAKDLHVVRLTYVAEFDGHIELGDEHLEYKWVGQDQLLAYELDQYLGEVVQRLFT